MKNNFNLDRPLCFLDLEATGLHILRDRIVQVGIIKFFPEEPESTSFKMLINPEIPISSEAQDVHGISEEDVIGAPTFAEAAPRINAFLEGADIAGYNSQRFDIPMLMEEMARAGYELDVDNRRLIDVQRIFHKMEPRTLEAAHRFYCGEEMKGAHDALEDVKATVAVLLGQIEMYKMRDYEERDGTVLERPIRNDMQALYDFTQDTEMIDVTRRIKYDSDGRMVFNFGKYKGKEVRKVITQDKQYYHWMLNKEFSVQVKRIIKNEYEKAQGEK